MSGAFLINNEHSLKDLLEEMNERDITLQGISKDDEEWGSLFKFHAELKARTAGKTVAALETPRKRLSFAEVDEEETPTSSAKRSKNSRLSLTSLSTPKSALKKAALEPEDDPIEDDEHYTTPKSHRKISYSNDEIEDADDAGCAFGGGIFVLTPNCRVSSSSKKTKKPQGRGSGKKASQE